MSNVIVSSASIMIAASIAVMYVWMTWPLLVACAALWMAWYAVRSVISFSKYHTWKPRKAHGLHVS